MTPKPPDILRKSHRHTDRKERATAKEGLRAAADDAADELAEDADDHGEEQLRRRKKPSTPADSPSTERPDDATD